MLISNLIHILQNYNNFITLLHLDYLNNMFAHKV